MPEQIQPHDCSKNRGFHFPLVHFALAGFGGFEAIYDYKNGYVQYTTSQVSYNTDCCGLSFQIHRVNIPNVRVDNYFRVAFAVANITELALVNVPVLLVSALVTDRIAVAQWGLTRVIASLVRGLCLQVTLPLGAELGHDHAIGDKERLRRLYAQGSAFVTALACLVVAALLPFWPDFFALWTHGSIPYDGPLAVTLLLGSAASMEIAGPGVIRQTGNYQRIAFGEVFASFAGVARYRGHGLGGRWQAVVSGDCGMLLVVFGEGNGEERD